MANGFKGTSHTNDSIKIFCQFSKRFNSDQEYSPFLKGFLVLKTKIQKLLENGFGYLD